MQPTQEKGVVLKQSNTEPASTTDMCYIPKEGFPLGLTAPSCLCKHPKARTEDARTEPTDVVELTSRVNWRMQHTLLGVGRGPARLP